MGWFHYHVLATHVPLQCWRAWDLEPLEPTNGPLNVPTWSWSTDWNTCWPRVHKAYSLMAAMMTRWSCRWIRRVACRLSGLQLRSLATFNWTITVFSYGLCGRGLSWRYPGMCLHLCLLDRGLYLRMCAMCSSLLIRNGPQIWAPEMMTSTGAA